MDFVRASNFIVNSLMLPGMFLESSYTYDDFPYIDLMASPEQQRNIEAGRPNYTPRVKYTDKVIRTTQNIIYPLRMIFIPVDFSTMPLADRVLNSPGSHIPAVLQISNHNMASTFIIHFHGNACDAAQVGAPARVESRMFNAHYLVVEYPGYGLAQGASSESMLNSIAFSAYLYVIKDLGVPPDRVVIYGRSVGCGLAVHLAAKLQALGHVPGALILHSPYTSIRDVAKDVMGKPALIFMNRWENWKLLCQKPEPVSAALKTPAEAAESTITKKSSDANISPDTSSGVDSYSIEVTMSSSAPKKASSRAMTSAEIDNLRAKYATCVPVTIEAPVLFIHADQDQIIDHHHSVTLNLARNRNKLSSELFTQRSNAIFRKDHNMFDYEVDVINPIRAFLKKHDLLTTSSRNSDSISFVRASQMSISEDENEQEENVVSLNLSYISCATLPPRQHLLKMLQTRDARAREIRKIAEAEAKAAKTAAVAGRTAGMPVVAAASTPTSAAPVEPTESERRDGPGSLFGVICNGWNSMKCIRCLFCCVPCFCCECHVSCCSATCNGIYYSVFDDEPDFEYTSRAQRRQSGGLKIPETRSSIDRNSIGTLHTIQPPTTQRPREGSISSGLPTYGNDMDRGEEGDTGASANEKYASAFKSTSPPGFEKVDADTSAGVGSPSGSNIETSASLFFSRPFDQQNRTDDTFDAMESIGLDESDGSGTLNPIQKSVKRKSNVPMYLPG